MGASRVGPQATREYLARMRARYERAGRDAKGALLTEVCEVTGYHRKAVIRLLRRAAPVGTRRRRGRRVEYGPEVVAALRAIWTAAGYPWSVRLKALLPAWVPWGRRRLRLSPATERALLQISARQIDRRLEADKRALRTRMYGRTKPGTLLKHHIPVKTERWDVQVPGFTEIDLVSHSGDSADGEFAHSLNVTDIHTTWVETQAVMGKGQERVRQALEGLADALPFALQGIDSDNGSEFINAHLYRYCQARGIQFTRGRPYKKDDNAHIEQKNWTHVRKLVGYDRYDSPAALAALNALYADLRLLQNLWLPSVKLVTKTRSAAGSAAFMGRRGRRSIASAPARPRTRPRLRRSCASTPPLIPLRWRRASSSSRPGSGRWRIIAAAVGLWTVAALWKTRRARFPRDPWKTHRAGFPHRPQALDLLDLKRRQRRRLG